MGKRTIEERIAVGDEAKRLLGSPLFNSVINACVADQIANLLTTTPGSEFGILAHSTLRGLDNIKQNLRALENDAAMARNEAERNS